MEEETLVDEKEQVKKRRNKITKTEVLRAVKYLCFATSAGVVQVGSFTLLNEVFSFEYWLSYFISLALSVVWNFTFNRKFTFRSINNVPIAMLEVVGYYVVFTPASIFWGRGLESVGWNEYLILALTMIVNLVTEYLFYTFVVYRTSIDSAISKNKNQNDKKDEGLARGNLENKGNAQEFEKNNEKKKETQ